MVNKMADCEQGNNYNNSTPTKNNEASGWSYKELAIFRMEARL
ncbi:MAG: hypothetical protein JWR61_1492 [Ferruginibacter sp.]|nr:hypothetical protein [Ferruginibacter sp.]MDB5276537.1 hypothetical protein [Ferruginibacter sp.]